MKKDDIELLLLKYNALGDRKRHFDSLFWQIPSLSLGGQAFLLSISLGSGTSPTSRLLSSVLGVFVAFVSLASLSRIRLYEFTITNQLVLLEKEIFGDAFTDTRSQEWKSAEHQALTYTRRSNNPEKPNRKTIFEKLFFQLQKVRSYEIWVSTLILFIVVGLYIIVATVINL
jgi:hypothetical protein